MSGTVGGGTGMAKPARRVVDERTGRAVPTVARRAAAGRGDGRQEAHRPLFQPARGIQTQLVRFRIDHSFLDRTDTIGTPRETVPSPGVGFASVVGMIGMKPGAARVDGSRRGDRLRFEPAADGA